MAIDARISICADVANPGHFFGCCGLLEVAHRLRPGAEGWFEPGLFHIQADPAISWAELVDALRNSEWLADHNFSDEKTRPVTLTFSPNGSTRTAAVRMDWWLDDGVGSSLKTWAGPQRADVISRAMLATALSSDAWEDWFNVGQTAYDPMNPQKPVEPFYFDARRYAHALDVGFSLDVQSAITTAYPAVEAFSFVGLQRFRPAVTDDRWSFEYWTWGVPLPAVVAAGAAGGAVQVPKSRRFRFALRFRDDQKRYKAFGWSQTIGGEYE